MTSCSKFGDQIEDMWKKVIRGYEIDVVDPFFDDHGFHAFQKILHIHGDTQTVLRNLAVLTEGASQGTSREKNGP